MSKLTRYASMTALGTATMAAVPAFGADPRDNLEATILVQDAARVVAEMKADPDATALLSQARGIYVVPDFTQAAVIVGGWGGDGVLLAANGVGASGWSTPAFYDVSAVSAGAQVGFTSGPVVLLLMSDQAVNAFRAGGSFSLEASAEFAIVDFTGQEQVSTEGSDVVVWSDVEGLYAGLTASAADIDWDEDANESYYGQEVTAAQVIDGQVIEAEADPLTVMLTN